ncbi:helix-turn-helix domain-containing protein [Weissella paramesenteroides]|uniref:helix-turn-helix domain-containing protein n=1 Tax=Weissella paramesenteroides TaxID=1249 RepID=UPI00223A73E6|nr:helix-turn-helix transcriptional regulator [Weissella paramesenteroides]MCT0485713.1 XRE family transcriptional regulator [Weissella paramesenteroides]
MRLKELRKAKGLTLRELSDEVGSSFGGLGNIENGRRNLSLSLAVKLADYFDVSVDYLIGHEKNA